MECLYFNRRGEYIVKDEEELQEEVKHDDDDEGKNKKSRIVKLIYNVEIVDIIPILKDKKKRSERPTPT